MFLSLFRETDGDKLHWDQWKQSSRTTLYGNIMELYYYHYEHVCLYSHYISGHGILLVLSYSRCWYVYSLAECARLAQIITRVAVFSTSFPQVVFSVVRSLVWFVTLPQVTSLRDGDETSQLAAERKHDHVPSYILLLLQAAYLATRYNSYYSSSGTAVVWNSRGDTCGFIWREWS